MKNNSGFAAVEGVLIIIAITIIGSVGYLGYHNFVAPKPASVTTSPSVPENSSSATVKVENSKDLDAAISTLDTVSLEDSDSAQFDSVTSNF